MLISKIKEIIKGAFFSFIALGISFGPIVYCLDKLINGKGLEPFRLGNLPIPWLQGVGATYQDVLIFFLVGLAASIVGIYFQYGAYREEEDFKRKYGIKEDKSFTDHMLDNIQKNASNHGDKYDDF